METFFRAYFPDANIKSQNNDSIDLLEDLEKKSSLSSLDEKRFQKVLKLINTLNTQNEHNLKSDTSNLKSINDKGVIENLYFTNSFNFIHFSK